MSQCTSSIIYVKLIHLPILRQSCSAKLHVNNNAVTNLNTGAQEFLLCTKRHDSTGLRLLVWQPLYLGFQMASVQGTVSKSTNSSYFILADSSRRDIALIQTSTCKDFKARVKKRSKLFVEPSFCSPCAQSRRATEDVCAFQGVYLHQPVLLFPEPKFRFAGYFH